MIFETLTNIKEDLWTYLSNTKKDIVMYGTGNGADKIIDVLDRKGIKLYGIFASDGFVRERTFRGFKVKRYSDICAEINDFIVIVSFASQREEVLENIYRINAERELYAPDVPVYGDGLFDIDYFKKNIERFRKVYNMLADDLSRKTFVNTLAYKLTGKIFYLRDCETTSEEIFNLIDRITKSKNYIDIGAYTGDTIEEYVKRFGNKMSVYAFEPDRKNYNKMKTRLNNNGINCYTFNYPVWDKCEYISFNASSGRSASAEKNITNILTNIETLSIDTLDLHDIGYIKIDAEGSDEKVLRGLSETIICNRPCIKVAAYHKNDDYFTLPEALAETKCDYKLYMRHLQYVPAWDTDFIFDFSKTDK